MHSHLSTVEEDVGFAVEMITKCTKLKVLVLAMTFGWLTFSTRLFLNVLNKSTSLETLSLEGLQLSYMVSPP